MKTLKDVRGGESTTVENSMAEGPSNAVSRTWVLPEAWNSMFEKQLPYAQFEK